MNRKIISISNGSLRMQKRPYNNISDKKKLYIIGGGIIAVTVIVLIIIFIIMGMNSSGKDKNSQEQEDGLKTNAVLRVNQLIDRYYEAKKNSDAIALMSLIYPRMTIEESELKLEAELVEDYQSIVCYTLPGLNKDSYVVWVEFEYKFYGIDKAAPALNRLYVIKSTETDEYQIYATPEDEVIEHMETLSRREDVMKLSANIEERLQKALSEDSKLFEFYSGLVGTDSAK